MDETDSNYTTIMGYIDQNPAAVLSTVDADGNPHGAVIYVITASHSTLCFVTKNDTQKYNNLTNHASISLTFFNEKERSTLQVTGQAYVANDDGMKDFVLEKMAKAHVLTSDWVPPVTQLLTGEYVVVGVEVSTARLTRFQTVEGVGIAGPSIIELKKR